MKGNSEVRVWNGIEVYHPEIDRAIRAVVKWFNSEAPGAVVLAGGFGCGKTSIARVALKLSGSAPDDFQWEDNGGAVLYPATLPVIEWTDGGAVTVYRATFFSEPDLLEEIKHGYKDDSSDKIIKRIKKSELLILDDIGAGYVKEESARWYEDIMWRSFDGRADKKTMITTNLHPPDLQARLGGRCWSRLREMTGGPENWVSMFNVPDYRNRGFE